MGYHAGLLSLAALKKKGSEELVQPTAAPFLRGKYRLSDFTCKRPSEALGFNAKFVARFCEIDNVSWRSR